MLRLGNTARSVFTGAIALWLALAAAVHAEDEISRLLADLNADRYEIRHQAAERLSQLGQTDEMQSRLATEYQRQLLDTKTPWEVREAIGTLRAGLKVQDVGKATTTRTTASAKVDDLNRLLDELEDNHSNVRAAAADRVRWLLDQPESIAPVMTTIKQRLAVGGLELPLRRQLESLYEAARGAWLLSAAPIKLPDVTDEQLRRLVDNLVHGESPAAERELLEALARDDVMPRAKTAIEARLVQADLAPESRTRLATIHEWALPAMVAEYWTGGRHAGIQHLLLNVPNKPENAERASLFDRCDERTAHCVSGNSLSPGDYPVGVFFPHPLQDAQFHLVNLPTTRRRMAYEFDVKRDAATRFVEISRRTLARFLGEKRLLSETDLHLLEQLDRQSVSKFIGPYLLAVDDAPQTTGHIDPRVRSYHRLLCLVIARHGTSDAVPGLARAIEDKRFLKDDSRASLAVPWIAALAIAHRDPWREVDAWLAELIASRELISADERTTVGATAAALLLTRHETAVATMGLTSVDDDLLSETLGMPEYRFDDPSRVDEVMKWWANRKESTKEPSASERSHGVAP